jgi:hypothetical protein
MHPGLAKSGIKEHLGTDRACATSRLNPRIDPDDFNYYMVDRFTKQKVDDPLCGESMREDVGSPCPPELDSYLVDPASSHMLVSKIKPCMSKYKQIHTVKLRMAH